MIHIRTLGELNVIFLVDTLIKMVQKVFAPFDVIFETVIIRVSTMHISYGKARARVLVHSII